MPFIPQEPTLEGSIIQRLDSDIEEEKELEREDPEFFSQTLPAAFRTQNTIGTLSNLSREETGVSDPVEGYDPFPEIEGTRYENFSDNFAYSSSPDESQRIKNVIDKQLADRETVERSGALGFLAEMVAGTIDPVNIAFGGPVQSVGRTSVLQVAKDFGRAGFISSTASEIVLQSTQEVRPAEETAASIGATTLLSVALGAGAGKAFSPDKYTSVSKGIEKDMEINDVEAIDSLKQQAQELNGDDSVGAARRLQTTLEQETLKPSAGLDKVTGFMTPMVRMAQSPSKKVREISQDLIENPIYFNKNAEGIASSQAVETLRREYEGGFATAIRSSKQNFQQMKKQASKDGAPSMKYPEFLEEVSFALRRGDRHDNPFVAKSAQEYRKRVFDPLKDKAIALGMLPEDVAVETAESYLTRVYNVRKIIAREDEWKDTIRNWAKKEAIAAKESFSKEIDNKVVKLEADLAELRAKKTLTAKQLERKQKLVAQIDDLKVERSVTLRTKFDTEQEMEDYIEEIVDSVTDKIKGYDSTTQPFNIEVATRGPLKERTFNIKDSVIEDFLENDVELVAERYTRVLGADVELQQKFGTTEFKDVKKQVIDDFKPLKAAAKSEKERTKLDKQQKDALRDLEAMWDLTRGNYKHNILGPDNLWKRTFNAVRSLNYMRLLGGVTASSFPDVAMPTLVHGFGRYMRDGLIPLARNLKGIKLSVEEARLAGAVTELELNGRLQTLAEITDPYARGTSFERFVSNGANTFSKVTGLAYWNQAQKSIASVITQKRILDNIDIMTSGRRLKPKENEYMAFLGIDSDMIGRIAKQVKAHGSVEEGGIRLAGVDNWTDTQARSALFAALNKDVNRTIVTKSIGDVPLFMNTEVGKTLTQFKSFAMASNQRVLMAGLQRADAATLQGASMMIALGMAVHAFKTWESGRTLDTSPESMLINGIDRSGLISVLMEVNNIAEKGGFPGLARLAGAPPARRFASRSAAEALVGPTFGTAVNMFEVSNALNSGEMTERDLHNIRKLMPYQNLLMFRKILDEAEGGLANTLGLDKK